MPHSTSSSIGSLIKNPGSVNASKAHPVVHQPSTLLRPSACYFALSPLGQRSDLGQWGHF